VGQTTTTKRVRKSRAKKPVSKSSFIQHQNDDYSNDLQKFEKGKGGSEKLFPLFQISFIYFWIFILFYQMQRWEKSNMQWKKRKENGGFGGERENSNANGGRRVENKMG
jgi:hypothetical protein